MRHDASLDVPLTNEADVDMHEYQSKCFKETWTIGQTHGVIIQMQYC